MRTGGLRLFREEGLSHKELAKMWGLNMKSYPGFQATMKTMGVDIPTMACLGVSSKQWVNHSV